MISNNLLQLYGRGRINKPPIASYEIVYIRSPLKT